VVKSFTNWNLREYVLRGIACQKPTLEFGQLAPRTLSMTNLVASQASTFDIFEVYALQTLKFCYTELGINTNRGRPSVSPRY
jgi:hypothetical protein